MRTLLSDLWAFTTGRTDNPIYRHELARWSHLPVWRRSGWLLFAVAFFASIILGGPLAVEKQLLVMNVPFLESDPRFIIRAAAVILLIWQEITKQLVCLSSAALAGIVISTQADDLLRLSSLPTRQIVLARLGAMLRPLLLWPLIIMPARCFLFTVAALEWGYAGYVLPNTAWLNFLATMPPAFGQAMDNLARWGDWLWFLYPARISAIQVVDSGWPWLVYYLFQPLFDFMLFTSLGLFAASRARTRAGGLSAALGLAMVAWILGYVGERALSVLIMLLWPMKHPYTSLAGDPPRWMVGMPAMSSSVIANGGPFVAMLVLITVIKLGLLLWLFYAAKQQLSLTRQG